MEDTQVQPNEHGMDYRAEISPERKLLIATADKGRILKLALGHLETIRETVKKGVTIGETLLDNFLDAADLHSALIERDKLEKEAAEKAKTEAAEAKAKAEAEAKTKAEADEAAAKAAAKTAKTPKADAD
jgi:hypothetical protein